MLLSNWVNRAHVNSNFQLDVGTFTLNFKANFEISNFEKILISKGKFSQMFKIPIFQNKAQMTFFCAPLIIKDAEISKAEF